jgi:aspartate aminotransferase
MPTNPVGADRVRNMAGSPTIAIMDKARKLKAAGRPVVDLSGGEPDFPTAAHITQAAVKSLEGEFTHYVGSRGIPELLRAIAHKLEAENGLKYDPQTDILVTPGAKLGLYVMAQALLNPGDEVILFDPCWVSYAPCAELAGATVKYVSIGAGLTPARLKADLEKAITPRTRLAIINTPNNPTGLGWSRDLLQIVADAATRHDFWVMSDEIYEKVVFDGNRHISIATLPGMGSRTLVLNGMSKAYAMTGWRLGYIAGPKAPINEMLKVYQHSITCATSFVETAGVAALEGPQEYIDYMTGRYKVRRDQLAARLNAVPGIRCDLVAGAFYAFPNIAGTGLNSVEFTDRLLESQAVAVTPGIAFGPSGEGYVRLSFANSDSMLEEGAARIGRFVASLKS